MPSLSTDPASEFRETNRRLRSWLDQAAPPANEPEAQRVVNLEEIATLLSELMQAGGRLRSLPANRDATLEHELAEYKEQVERLRAMMPLIHAALLRERARLERERSRLAAASQWAERSRQTL